MVIWTHNTQSYQIKLEECGVWSSYDSLCYKADASPRTKCAQEKMWGISLVTINSHMQNQRGSVCPLDVSYFL